MSPEGSLPRDELTLPELCSRVGLSVRTVRFYTGRGLVPPPIRKGRCGYYSADHIARLELVRELQAHGFTLAAIEGYLARIPDDATPDTIALHGTLIAPWKPDRPETLSPSALATRAGRVLSPVDLDTLEALGIIEPAGRGHYDVAVAQLSVGVAILELGLPLSAAVAAQQIFTTHGRAVAEELTALFLAQVWPAYKEAGAPAEHIRSLVERFKPVTINALVTAYETAVDETKREAAARRADGRDPPHGEP
ncbi:MAG: MerR family transcriptional regulator [Jiangellaceae bacterium]